jgi:hypothetical protein
VQAQVPVQARMKPLAQGEARVQVSMTVTMPTGLPAMNTKPPVIPINKNKKLPDRLLKFQSIFSLSTSLI